MTDVCSDAACGGSVAAGELEPPFGNYFVSTYPPFSQWTAEEVPRLRGELSGPPSGPDAPLGLYVHIPFCAKRCDYCYYLSFADTDAARHDQYVEAVLAELALYRQSPALGRRPLEFIYFGGGTPSLLNDSALRRLVEGLQRLYPWRSIREATFECAPRSATGAKLDILRDAGISRLSLGVQSLDDEVLRLSGRMHLQRDVKEAYERIRRVGFDVVNIDLIVGLPGEDDGAVDHSLEGVIAMAPESVTIYQLEVPQNTPLFRRTAAEPCGGAVPSWPVKHARLERCFSRLEAAGYTVRSAYAAVRDPVRHAFVYQDAQYRGADLLGIGLSSFSYLAGTHFQNMVNMQSYSESVARGELPVWRTHRLSSEERLIREVVLQLKLGRLDRAYFADKFGADILGRFDRPLQRLADRGWLATDETGVRVTRDGLVRVDRLLKEFYLPQHRDVRYS